MKTLLLNLEPRIWRLIAVLLAFWIGLGVHDCAREIRYARTQDLEGVLTDIKRELGYIDSDLKVIGRK